ncbi:MAG: transporter substrate-binding domain-containing protein, partial [Pseudomonadales bacterium]|nr:transporter substrate-binding domain-containing protein [Pseudomonadales bacterium]
GLNFGWSYGDAIDSARASGLFSTDDSVKNNVANFRKLIGERIDCFIVDELAARRIISQQGFDGLVEQLDIPVSVNAGYLVFSKALQKKGVIDAFNKAMKQLRHEGAYEAIVDSVIQQP